MFETQSNINYGNGINLGRAVVFMNRNNHAAKIDFIYMVDENGNWSFYYEDGTCLSNDERAELENWFMAASRRSEDEIIRIDELHEEELIYDVCVYGHVYIIEADNENEAKMIACDTYYEETGLKAYTDDEAVVWKIHGEYPYEWQ